MSLDRFSKRMAKLADNIDENSTKLQKRVALAVHQTIVLATPVDEGTARSNWQVGINGPVSGTREAYFPGKGLGISEGANADAAIREAQAVVLSVQNASSIYITNNLPYIERLNAGSSSQAPASFIEKAVQSGAIAAAKASLLNDN
jgi:hypothetical protein